MRWYVRGGYGWLRYRVRSVTVGAFPVADTSGGRMRGYLPPLLPSYKWWPNTVYAGTGVEVFSPRRYWLLGWLGYGLRAEYSAFEHRLRFDDASGRRDRATLRHDLALSLVLGW